MVVTTARPHSDLGEVRSGQPDRMRRQSRRSGQAPMGGGLLPPVIATAVGARGRLRDRNADRPDSDGPPLRGPRPRSSRSTATRSSS